MKLWPCIIVRPRDGLHAGVARHTIRVRQQSVTGPLVGVAQVVSVTAVQTALDIGELDPTLIQLPAIYVVTMSVATGTAVVNRVVFTAEGATAFE